MSHTSPAREGARVLVSVVVIAVTVLPLAWMVSLSFKGGDDINNAKFLPSKWSWENYRTVFRNDLFTDALRNSIGISLIATVIAVACATGTAYAIVRLEFPGKRLILLGALAIAMFPTIAVVGPLFDMWRSIGLFDTWIGLILPYLSFTMPLSIWTLTSFFKQIPWALEDAARIDGASGWQAFRYVIAPMAIPAVVTTAILVFFFAWNDFVFSVSLTSTNASRTVPAALAFFTGASQFQQPTAAIAAASVVVSIPVVVLVLVFQKRIVAGITSGAVKE
ncbi:carbohydrate ABC transporter permease [Streptomyces sp. SID3343]|uniref:ABC transporter permease subunit n=1 Tax=Streptomyces sp. SID3343 TaxID=2690260 RepID=UPI00136833A7|nr:ABC transporter permease subunit [Streptomyces sp. SID3343]